MSKPWEQVWQRNGTGHIQATDAIQIEVKTAFWRVEGGEEEALRQVEETQQFLLASGDMARALLSALEARSDLVQTPEGQRMRLWMTVEQVEAISASLRKAGVPL